MHHESPYDSHNKKNTITISWTQWLVQKEMTNPLPLKNKPKIG